MEKTTLSILTLFIYAMLSLSPVYGSAPADVKCVQEGLLAAGFDPNGIDGAIGGGTRSAAAKYSKAMGGSLPVLNLQSSAQWCRQFMAMSVGSPNKIKSGKYRAVFTSFNRKKGKRVPVYRCGILEIDYDKGHFYRLGICNNDLSNIADRSKVSQTGVVKVSDKKIEILQAKYTILDISKDQLIGEWVLNNFRNPVLIFRRFLGR